MKRVNKLYCVFKANGDIIGRFLSLYRAIDFMKDYSFIFPNEIIFLKTMTVDGYYKYIRRQIDEYKVKGE